MGADVARERQGSVLKRVGLAALMGIVGLNIWTGSPLLGLWVGSRVQGDGPPQMHAIFVVAIVIAIVSFVLAQVLARLGRLYDEAAGTSPTVRHHTPWLRSMRGERPQYGGVEPRLTALERILVVMVVVAALLFEIWFFFFSASPIDQRTGRSEVDAPSEQLALSDLKVQRWNPASSAST